MSVSACVRVCVCACAREYMCACVSVHVCMCVCVFVCGMPIEQKVLNSLTRCNAVKM